MIIELSENGSRLLDDRNFRALKISAPSALTGPALGKAFGGLGRLVSATDALVSPEALMVLARCGDEPEWQMQYRNMVDQARSHGWIDPATGWIKVHVEFI